MYYIIHTNRYIVCPAFFNVEIFFLFKPNHSIQNVSEVILIPIKEVIDVLYTY